MNRSVKTLLNTVERHLRLLARSRTRQILLGYNDRLLVDAGFSRDKLEAGVHAWPWRLSDEPMRAVMHSAAPGKPADDNRDKAIAELQGHSVTQSGKAEPDRGNNEVGAPHKCEDHHDRQRDAA